MEGGVNIGGKTMGMAGVMSMGGTPSLSGGLPPAVKHRWAA